MAPVFLCCAQISVLPVSKPLCTYLCAKLNGVNLTFHAGYMGDCHNEHLHLTRPL